MKRVKRLLAGLLICMVVLTTSATNVYAAPKTPIGFVPNGGGTSWMYSDGSILKNDWLRMNGLTYHFDANGMMQTGLQQIGKKIYYFGGDGLLVVNAFANIGGSIYYFGPDGAMVKNTIVNGFQIGPDGKVIVPSTNTAAQGNASAPAQNNVTPPVTGSAGGRDAIAAAVNQIIASVTNASMTQEQKLAACYNHIMASTSYQRSYEVPSGDWTVPYAMQVYSTGTGNCYKYAAAFGYLAKALGYETKVITGEVRAARGGTTPHSWVEIYINGGWYVFDPELQDAKPNYNMYMRTYQNYPIKPLNKSLEWPIYY